MFETAYANNLLLLYRVQAWPLFVPIKFNILFLSRTEMLLTKRYEAGTGKYYFYVGRTRVLIFKTRTFL